MLQPKGCGGGGSGAAWQGLFDHGALREGERVRVLGTKDGVGHLAVQLAGDALVGPDQPCDLVFDTAGGDALAASIGSAPRIVSVAEEADHVTYFIVESNRPQLISGGFARSDTRFEDDWIGPISGVCCPSAAQDATPPS